MLLWTLWSAASTWRTAVVWDDIQFHKNGNTLSWGNSFFCCWGDYCEGGSRLSRCQQKAVNSKKLWTAKERISVQLQPLDAREGALQTRYWHMNLYNGHVSKSLSDPRPSPGGTGLGCVVHWPLSHRAAHGPFCAIKEAWPSRTCQLLISVGLQEQNKSTFGAFSRLWFPIYVVFQILTAGAGLPAAWAHEQLSSYNGQKARAGEPAFLSCPPCPMVLTKLWRQWRSLSH